MSSQRGDSVSEGVRGITLNPSLPNYFTHIEMFIVLNLSPSRSARILSTPSIQSEKTPPLGGVAVCSGRMIAMRLKAFPLRVFLENFIGLFASGENQIDRRIIVSARLTLRNEPCARP
ncbi:MAG: hypothetical protein LW720_14080 [Pirellula sp.]|jgi:hypothetical protein|nr:hypothetical protein [Pirellula sp.]